METPQEVGEETRPLLRPRLVAVRPTCPGCLRTIELRADLVALADGRRAVDADGLRRALRLHMRLCPGG